MTTSYSDEVKVIDNMHEALISLAQQIATEPDEKNKALLIDKFISVGKELLLMAQNIQNRYFDVAEIGIEISDQMQWLYVTAMRAMQDTYDYGLASMHYRLVREWPELVQWLKKRRER